MRKTINLLPAERKNKLNLKRINFLLLQNGAVIFLALMVFFLFLLANLFILNVNKNTATKELGRSESLNEVVNGAKEKINKEHSKAEDFLKVFNREEFFWINLNEVNKNLPKMVYLKEITADRENIRIKGWSENRNDLLNFENSLRSVGFFKEIETPISNLTSQNDIDFEIIIKL